MLDTERAGHSATQAACPRFNDMACVIERQMFAADKSRSGNGYCQQISLIEIVVETIKVQGLMKQLSQRAIIKQGTGSPAAQIRPQPAQCQHAQPPPPGAQQRQCVAAINAFGSKRFP